MPHMTNEQFPGALGMAAKIFRDYRALGRRAGRDSFRRVVVRKFLSNGKAPAVRSRGTEAQGQVFLNDTQQLDWLLLSR